MLFSGITAPPARPRPAQKNPAAYATGSLFLSALPDQQRHQRLVYGPWQRRKPPPPLPQRQWPPPREPQRQWPPPPEPQRQCCTCSTVLVSFAAFPMAAPLIGAAANPAVPPRP